MKRSEAIDNIACVLVMHAPYPQAIDITKLAEVAREILDDIEQRTGMAPPPIKAKQVRPKDYRWGGYCSMRCICSECDPDYDMYQWEPE